MRLYQKQVEKFLNKEYDEPFEDFLNGLRNIVPGNVEIIKVETVDAPKYGKIEVYNIFNTYDENKDMSEEEWNKTCDVYLEFWKINLPDNKFIIQ